MHTVCDQPAITPHPVLTLLAPSSIFSRCHLLIVTRSVHDLVPSRFAFCVQWLDACKILVERYTQAWVKRHHVVIDLVMMDGRANKSSIQSVRRKM